MDHGKIEYEPFRKNFYVEVPELAKMSQEGKILLFTCWLLWEQRSICFALSRRNVGRFVRWCMSRRNFHGLSGEMSGETREVILEYEHHLQRFRAVRSQCSFGSILKNEQKLVRVM